MSGRVRPLIADAGPRRRRATLLFAWLIFAGWSGRLAEPAAAQSTDLASRWLSETSSAAPSDGAAVVGQWPTQAGVDPLTQLTQRLADVEQSRLKKWKNFFSIEAQWSEFHPIKYPCDMRSALILLFFRHGSETSASI